ncbi:TraE/TraK family type IV conjugative transfer system protein [Vibrio harveyi]|uniref:TraE/TraK family type IV conjugative transfer system protein n=1 Tax=Vibrio harveyi TaxID=669 RepID=UPI003BB50DCD
MKKLFKFQKNEQKPKRDNGLLNDHDLLLKDVRLTKYCAIGAIVCSLLVYGELEDVKENGKTVISYPSGLTASIMGEDADASYTQLMMGYLMSMYGNVHAGNVRDQHNQILRFVHPSTVATVREKLRKRADVLAKYKTFSFTMSTVSNKPLQKVLLNKHKYHDVSTPVYEARRTINVKKYVADNKPKTEQRDFVMDFTVDNSVAYILDVREEKVKND